MNNHKSSTNQIEKSKNLEKIENRDTRRIANRNTENNTGNRIYHAILEMVK